MIERLCLVKRRIQTVKHVLRKAKQSGHDLETALLYLRDCKLPSPVELLMGRKVHSPLPTKMRDIRGDYN